MPRPFTCAHAPKGCDACRLERRRRYAREFARKKREVAFARRQAESLYCQRKHGRDGLCGARLRFDSDGRGGMVTSCERCARFLRGICLECPAPVAGKVGKARRCALHRKLFNQAVQDRYKAAHRDEVRAKGRARYQNLTPEERERRLALKRAWRQANPKKVRGQKRRESLRASERTRRYMARYRAKHREHYRQMARERYHAEHPERPNLTCRACGGDVIWAPGFGRPPRTCDACVVPSERKRRKAVRAARAAREAAQLAAEVAAKPVRIRVPRNRKVAPTGERLCLAAGCTTPVAGRQKKCAPCKERDRQAARALLEAHYIASNGRCGAAA